MLEAAEELTAYIAVGLRVGRAEGGGRERRDSEKSAWGEHFSRVQLREDNYHDRTRKPGGGVAHEEKTV